jgi:guanylate kinase
MYQILIITGPSGVGKTVLSEHLLEQKTFKRCITCTSRVPRPKEKDGVDYFFLTPEEFKVTRESGGFVEYSQHYQAEYGIRQIDLESVLQKGHVLLVLDCGGAKAVVKQYPSHSVFIAPPSIEALEERLVKRSGSAKDRIIYAAKEMEQQKHFDHVLVNKDLESAKQAISDWADQIINS